MQGALSQEQRTLMGTNHVGKEILVLVAWMVVEVIRITVAHVVLVQTLRIMKVAAAAHDTLISF